MRTTIDSVGITSLSLIIPFLLSFNDVPRSNSLTVEHRCVFLSHFREYFPLSPRVAPHIWYPARRSVPVHPRAATTGGPRPGRRHAVPVKASPSRGCPAGWSGRMRGQGTYRG